MGTRVQGREVVVRPATPDDVAAVAEVWRAAWHDGHRGHVPDVLVEARDAGYFAARAHELVGHTAVAVAGPGVGEEVLGVAIVKGDELMQLMVSGAARGRGVGALLLAEAERRAVDAGHDEIWLAVVPGNTTARRFYEAHGWADRGAETYAAATLTETTVAVTVHRYTKPVGPAVASGQG